MTRKSTRRKTYEPKGRGNYPERRENRLAGDQIKLSYIYIGVPRIYYSYIELRPIVRARFLVCSEQSLKFITDQWRNYDLAMGGDHKSS